MSIPHDLLAHVLELDEKDRAELVERLLVSLGDEGPEHDPDGEACWAAEIERRIQEVDEGRAVLLSWEEVRAQVRKPTSRAQEP